MFHVPESERLRHGRLASDESDGNNGAFVCKGVIPGRSLLIIASDGMGWEHVSVHVENGRGKSFIPTWAEMTYVKSLFWDDEDAVMQLHPPRSTWVNNHPHTLHLWRPIGKDIPLPPVLTVGNPNASSREIAKIMKMNVPYHEAVQRVLDI